MTSVQHKKDIKNKQIDEKEQINIKKEKKNRKDRK